MKPPAYQHWEPAALRAEDARLTRLSAALDAERRLRTHGGQASDRPYYLHSVDELRAEARRLIRDRQAVADAMKAGGRP